MGFLSSLLFKENISASDIALIWDSVWLEYSFMYITAHSGHIGILDLFSIGFVEGCVEHVRKLAECSERSIKISHKLIFFFTIISEPCVCCTLM